MCELHSLTLCEEKMEGVIDLRQQYCLINIMSW